jgi:hypothetical protein
MSMNIGFKAIREIYVPKIEKYDFQIEFIGVWQTPTNVTYQIHGSNDPVSAYIDWVDSERFVTTVPVYADDDFLGEDDPIGYEEYDEGKEHIQDFKSKISTLLSEGYEIKPVVL